MTVRMDVGNGGVVTWRNGAEIKHGGIVCVLGANTNVPETFSKMILN